MTLRVGSLLVLVGVMAWSCAGRAADRYAAEPARIAFVEAAVVYPGRNHVVPHQTVIAERGRIVAVGPSHRVTPPTGTFVVQASGRYLIPGLIDAHVHHFEQDRGYFERELLLYLVHGVTSVRIMNGSERALRARDHVRAGNLTGPRLVVCSPQVTRTSGGSSPDSASAVVGRYVARGYDCLKIYTGPKPDAFMAAVTTADSLGLPTAGHAATRLPFELLLHLGSIEHVEEIQWFFGIARFGGAIIPTIGGFDFRPYLDASQYKRLRSLEASRYVPDSWLDESDNEQKKHREAGKDIDSLRRSFGEMYERALSYTAFFHERGVRLVMGTDAGNVLQVPGFATEQELATMVRVGLTPAEALTSATESAAELMRIDGGRIEPGRVSDLVLLRANPLLNISNIAEIEGVLAGTKWVDRKRISAILADLRRR